MTGFIFFLQRKYWQVNKGPTLADPKSDSFKIGEGGFFFKTANKHWDWTERGV